MRVDGPVGRMTQKMASSRWFSKVAPPVLTPIDRFLHKVTGGRFLLSKALVPTVMLTTTGAKSGQPRQVPLACIPDGELIYLVGSNFGREHHPAWTGNLIKTPRAEVSFRGETFPVDAARLSDEEKAEIWPTILKVWPTYDSYVERSGRNLRVFRLSRAEAEAAAPA
jgi:deazaflavin-dependent oxidoreductase (nitroreductase family)